MPKQKLDFTLVPIPLDGSFDPKGRITPEQALQAKLITKKQYEKIRYPMGKKHHDIMLANARAHNETYLVRVDKIAKGEPLTCHEAEYFRPGVPEGYVRQGDLYVKDQSDE
jgi:hypothetical protein